jgi:uncharacterized Zn finger protein (UPF0148 family)
MEITIMGKGHRDNHAARLKRGNVAFDKKKVRRAGAKKVREKKCPACGSPCREEKRVAGVCPNCAVKIGL